MVISAIRGLVGGINTVNRPLVEKHPCYGCGKQYDKTQLQQIITDLIYKDCLAELHKVSPRGFSIVYLTVGSNADKLYHGELSITITQRKKVVTQPTPTSHTLESSKSIIETPFIEECEVEVTPRIPEEFCTKLYEGLIASRSMFASFFGSAAASVMTNPVMEEISRTVPTTEEELVTIDKMTPVFVKKFGASILNVIKEFLTNYDIKIEKPFVSRGLLRKRQQEKMEAALKEKEKEEMNKKGIEMNDDDIDDDLWRECEQMEQELSQSTVNIPLQVKVNNQSGSGYQVSPSQQQASQQQHLYQQSSPNKQQQPYQQPYQQQPSSNKQQPYQQQPSLNKPPMHPPSQRSSLSLSPPSSSSHSKYFTSTRNEPSQIVDISNSSPSPIKSSFVSKLKDKVVHNHTQTSSPFTSNPVTDISLSSSIPNSSLQSFSDDDFSLFSDLYNVCFYQTII